MHAEVPQPDEVLLLGPGPSPVSPTTRSAQAWPLLGHLDPQFLQLMDQVQEGLRGLFGTRNRFTLPVSGTGSAGMEICLHNLVEPGERVVVAVHGVFGGRMADLCRRLGAEVVEVASGFCEPIDMAGLEQALAAAPTALCAFVHAETSTGVQADAAAIAGMAHAHGARVLMDCVTSLGGIPIEVDAWGIDAAFSGTQKCLSVPPGLSPVTFSDAALEKVRARAEPPRTWYFDTGLLDGYWGGERAYHHTAPVSMNYALAAGLAAIQAEGLDAVHARHRQVAQAFYRCLPPLGLTCLVDAEVRLPMLTTLGLPEGVDELAVRKHLREHWAIEIGGGLGALKGKALRVGLMGHGARLESLRRLVPALGDALQRAGQDVDPAAALQELPV